MNATPTTGFLAKRTDNYVIALYDISRGDGDLFNCERTYGCGESISPDGSLVTANAGTHAEVSLVDMTARKRHGFRVSQWDGDPTKGLPREKMEWAWQSFRWSVNSMNWISVTQGKLKLDSTYETFFQDAMLYDWVNQKQINVTGNKTGSFDRPAGFWEIGGKEFFLGSFSGKAPLTVESEQPATERRSRVGLRRRPPRHRRAADVTHVRESRELRDPRETRGRDLSIASSGAQATAPVRRVPLCRWHLPGGRFRRAGLRQ